MGGLEPIAGIAGKGAALECGVEAGLAERQAK